ncbi:hypothetical protein ACFSKM_04555 [Ancylobacter dichloromethanicus]
MNHQRPISPGLSNPPKAVAAPALNVGFILADNFTLSAFSLIVDQLRLAADDGDRSRPILARWQVMSSRPEPIRASLRHHRRALRPVHRPG